MTQNVLKKPIYPVAYTLSQEKPFWIPVTDVTPLPDKPHSIIYSNGKIWDEINGWREKE